MPSHTKWVRRLVERHYPGHAKVFRYVASGSVAEVVGLILLYAFTDLLGIWYLVSSMVAFVIAFGASFALQKFWTFQDHRKENIHKQAGVYFAVALVNLGFNTLLIFVFVEYIGFYYLVAQVLASFLVAFESFFVYQHFIFHKPATTKR